MWPWRRVPKRVNTRCLGVLQLGETRYDGGYKLRWYDPVNPPVVVGCGELKNFVVWATGRSGKPMTAAQTAEFVDATWIRLFGDFDRIVNDAVDVVRAAIAESYEDQGPAAQPMMQRSTLNMIGINASGDWSAGNSHMLGFWAAEFVGGHDLRVELDHNLEPFRAYFDG